MPIPKMLAGGLAASLALVGGGAIAHEFIDSSSHAATSTPPASVRNIADNSAASAIYNGAKDSVTYIVANTSEGQATGTGFVVSKDGLIVTNDHVVDGASQVKVMIGTSQKAQDATVVGADPSRDLALIKVDASNLKTLTLADSSNVGVGDAAYAIGNPYGLDQTFTSGIVSALNRTLQAPDGTAINGAIQTDAALNPGNSGGPLLNSGGQVIGVNSQIETGQSGGGEGGNVGIGFAIPSNTVKTFIDEAKSGKLAPQQQTQQDQQQTQQDQQQQDPWSQLQQQQGQDQQQQQADPYGQGQDQQSDPWSQLQQQLEQQQGQDQGQDQQSDPWSQLQQGQDQGQQIDPYGFLIG
jgi:putative serine protease PepD